MSHSQSHQNANALFMQALGFVQAGLHHPAEQALQKVIALYEAQQEPQAAAFARMTLARVYADQAKYAAARDVLQQVVEDAEARQDTETLVRALYEVGAVAERMHDTTTAREIYTRVLQTADNAGDRATAALRLGALADAAGQRDEAIAFYRTAFEIFQTIEHDIGIARAAYELARLLAEDNMTEARQFYEQAHTLAEIWGDETLLQALRDLPFHS
ncbi:tetratricopeptide repeat protein [Ardenticatena maritima]|nr:tetratricopeptide repeat protein [Ardenticatena maritima]